MLMAVTHGRYSLFIEHDPDPLNPRTDWDPFGKMICFHRRYAIGDKHRYDNSSELLDELLDEHSERVAKPLYGKLRRGEIKDARLNYDRSAREWTLQSYGDFSGKWYDESSYPPGLKRANLPQSFVSDVCEFLSAGEKLGLLAMIPGMIIQPLYLYDHSIQSISTSSFVGRAVHAEWDSGLIGWTYATPEMIRVEYGTVDAETITMAQKSLVSAVEIYDAYLQGECYGFRLYDDEEEIDSCWGFLGDIDQAQEDIRHHLNAECKDLVDKLEHCSAESVADYFWQRSYKAG